MSRVSRRARGFVRRKRCVVRRRRRVGWMRVWVPRFVVCVALICLCVFGGYAILDILFPFDIGRLEALRRERCSTLVFDREGNPLRGFRGTSGGWTFWVSNRDVNPWVERAFIAVEDKRFRFHSGVDVAAVFRAAALNVVRGRRVSGASTITMQVIRMLERNPRTYASKVEEAFRALQLERSLGKDEILEYYLNLCPFGGNVYGIESASLLYFGKRSSDLTLSESALLAGIPQSPSRLRPDRFAEQALERRDKVLRAMRERGFITRDELLSAVRDPVDVFRRRIWFRAPHFARLAWRKARKGKGGGSFRVMTTLDPIVQELSERVLGVAVERFPGIHNGAVVVIENGTGAVRGFVGSPDFFDSAHSGQVDACLSARPSGSTLKPFLYAMAFADGRLVPTGLVSDEFVDYDGYAPRNYDRAYHGMVTVSEALVNSYNVPATRLLNEIGVGEFISKLRECGIGGLGGPPGRYGLSLILGSGNVRLVELTAAYAVFPNGGVFVAPRFFEGDTIRKKRVFPASSSDMISFVLKDMTRLPEWDAARRGRWGCIDVAWKTGTSFGLKDSWTVAYTPTYTVGVWLGNADGKSSVDLVGIKSAAPVALEISIRASLAVAGGRHSFGRRYVATEIDFGTGMPLGEGLGDGGMGICDPGIHYPVGDKVLGFVNALEIVSPLSGEYSPLSGGVYECELDASGVDGEIFWFVDGRFVGAVSAGTRKHVGLSSGLHRIACRGVRGGFATRTVRVREKGL